MSDHTAIVLIGEPDQATRLLYQRTLAAAFTVMIAPDGEAILHILRNHPVAVLILEPAIFAPSEWERLQVVSRTCAASGVLLVICSTQDERRRGRELGAIVYFVKPTLPSVLLETVRQVVQSTKTSC